MVHVATYGARAVIFFCCTGQYVDTSVSPFFHPSFRVFVAGTLSDHDGSGVLLRAHKECKTFVGPEFALRIEL